MQPRIIENFISEDAAKYLNDYFIKNIKLDDQGYANIGMSEFLPIYNDNYLFNTLKKETPEEAVFYDMLKLILDAEIAEFGFAKDQIGMELYNYRNFGVGQDFKEYHIDDYGRLGMLYTALLYLNDDYEGGEIIFYDAEYPEESGPVTYKPKSGSLFLFRGIDGHKVNEVVSGQRALLAMNCRNPAATKPLSYGY
jgi:hypothetical protein